MEHKPTTPSRQQLEKQVINKIKTMSDAELKRLAGGLAEGIIKHSGSTID